MVSSSRVDIIPEFFAPGLSRRMIWVYLPAGYDESTEDYPVIYMHDGQNLFDDDASFVGSWGVETAIDKLVKDNKIDQVPILIAIENGRESRADEFSPWPQNSNIHFEIDKGGKGDVYAEFIVNTLRPFINKHYRTKTDKESTAIAGSSLGAFISLYIALKFDSVFSKVALFSPAFWFAKKELLEFIADSATSAKDLRLYFDLGTKESEEDMRNIAYQESTSEVYEMMKMLPGINENNLKFLIEKDAIHHETAWKRRFPGALQWLFKTPLNK